MDKIFRVGERESKYPLDLPLIKGNGELEDFYKLENGENKQISLEEWISGQVCAVSKNASNGDGSKNASNGYGSKNASNGYGSNNASNGDGSKNASNGYGSNNASNG